MGDYGPYESVYADWFRRADKDRDNRLTGQDAVRFFELSGLSRDTLAKVWTFSDTQRRGYLDFKGFCKAMDLIFVAQQTGGQVSLDSYHEAKDSGIISPPRMRGLEAYSKPASAASSTGEDAMSGNSSNPFGMESIASAMPTPTPPPVRQIKSSNWSAKKALKPMSTKDVTSIVDGLKKIYFSKVRPLEEMFKFGAFFSPLMEESDFEAKPSVLLLGQYSTGKSTFIKYLLGRDYPGINIGPEPTTDRFVVVMHGVDERRTPGNTLVVQPDKPYQGLAMYGNGFLSKFEGAQCQSALLQEITLVDTPGVLSGEKQRVERTYNFIDVCGWFASRCDLILLLFDPHKVDVSDELKQVIHTLKGHDDKVRVVLNKADQVDQQQLMRVYGALMWSLSKVFRSPEVVRLYVGSFNSAPIRTDINPHGKELFIKEQDDLLHDLYEIPQRCCDRKVNEFVKRVRAFRIHLLIMMHLRRQMPALMGKKSAQEKLMNNIVGEFGAVQREHHLPPGDFPDPQRYREIMSGYDLSAFPKVDKRQVKIVEDVLSIDIPNIVRQFDNPYS